MPVLGLRAYARHRGVSLTAVQKAIHSGRIPTTADGKIDSDRADAEWKAIIALARYGGLRTPSETMALRWIDIDWERG